VFSTDRLVPTVQVVHVYNHWVCITDYNPYFEVVPNDKTRRWFLYDSLNMQEFYIPYLKPCLKRYNIDVGLLEIVTCDVPQQQPHPIHGQIDCGIFALAYAQAICYNIAPIPYIMFNQFTMRNQYNDIINSQQLTMFQHNIMQPYSINWKKYTIDLSDVFVNW
jgi:hypothetical protein